MSICKKDPIMIVCLRPYLSQTLPNETEKTKDANPKKILTVAKNKSDSSLASVMYIDIVLDKV